MRTCYWNELRKVANDETRTVWTIHRSWLAIAGGVAALVLGALRGGMDLTSATSILVNALGGLGIAFAGTYLINLVRAPFLVYIASREKIRALESERPFIVSKRYPRNLGNESLKKEALAAVAGIKDLYLREAEDAATWLYRDSLPIDAGASKQDDSRHFWASQLKREKAKGDVHAVYWKDYQTKAILLRDEMRERLGGVDPKKKFGVFDIQYEVGQAGSFTVQDVASELEWLALQIPDSSA